MNVKIICRQNNDCRTLWFKDVPDLTGNDVITDKFKSIFDVSNECTWEICCNSELPHRGDQGIFNWANV